MVYKIYGNTYPIKDDLNAFKCKWNPDERCWVTPWIQKDDPIYKRITSLVNAVDGSMVAKQLSNECQKIQSILRGGS